MDSWEIQILELSERLNSTMIHVFKEFKKWSLTVETIKQKD